MANFVSPNQIQIQIGLVLLVRHDTHDEPSQPWTCPTCPNELNHLDATALAHFDFGHVLVVNGVVERIMAARVVPAVAFEALYLSLR